MKLQYKEVKDRPQKILSLTGYQSAEFEALLKTFSDVWRNYIRYYTLTGEKRQRIVQKERKNAQLPTDADKLFFILYQYKNNCLQETLATTFGMEQPHACFWLKLLRPILKETLKKEQVLPERQAERINRAIMGIEEIIIDGVERAIERSRDNETQEEDYSGKKKDIALRISF